MHSVGLALVLVIRIYDMAGLSAAELAAARQAASDVLASARVNLVWVSCPRTAGLRDAACDGVPLPTDLIVRLTSASVGLTKGALAEAYVDTQTATGSLATVYADRVRALALDSGVEPGAVMGRAIAHEVGHLLFGSSAHSSSGVMRAVWSAPLLRRDNPRAWTFSKREAQQLRSRLAGRIEHVAARQPALVEWVPAPPCTKGSLTCVATQ